MRGFSRNRKRRQRGAVTVEFAFTLPLLLLFVFSGFELSRVNMMRNSIENAAYEGARRGIVPGATAADCEATTQTILDIIDIKNSSITVTPTTIDANTETVTVSVEVPLTQSNGYVTPRFYLGKVLRASITLPREMG